MYSTQIKIRVRYSETDRMGYVYYGNYAQYFEVARVEALRSLGFSYKMLEDSGIMLPVMEYSIRYFKPAYYDDELHIKVSITKTPSVRIHFRYECFNAHDELLNTAETTLVFINKETKKPCAAPKDFIDVVSRFF